MAELKPCPFCGGANLLEYTTKQLHQAPRYTIKCMDCMAEMARSKPQKAKDAWNRRAEDGNT